jgi:ornithine cyclodeaminase
MRLWTDDDVRASTTVAHVIDSLEWVLTHEAAGTAWNLDKTMTTWQSEPGTSSAHALGAVDRASDLAVFKTWVNTPSGAAALMSMFTASNGTPLGVAEAGAAGALRTAAASGLATKWLAATAADELCVIGAGRQALRQVEAVAAVRPLRRVRLWNRTLSKADTLADQVRSALEVETVVVESIEEATADCPIVTLITRADQPFLRLDHLAPEAHLNAVGAILPSHAEFDIDILRAAALVVVDNEPNARRGSRELREYLGATPDADWSQVHSLAAVVTHGTERPVAPRCTVFKGMGMGLSDLAVARLMIGDQP